MIALGLEQKVHYHGMVYPPLKEKAAPQKEGFANLPGSRQEGGYKTIL